MRSRSENRVPTKPLVSPRIDRVRPVVVVHAGAGGGADLREHEADARRGLREAIGSARALLEAGGAALDAAISAVRIMEDVGLFNAGYGSALCSDGTVEMSAAVMRGSDRAAGAVAGIRVIRHPIAAA